MFGVTKYLALIMAIKRNNFQPKTIIKLHKAHIHTGPTKIRKNDKKCKNLQHFGPKNS